MHSRLYVKPDLEELIPTLLKSKSDSTTEVRQVPPFPATFVVAYIFKACKRYSSFFPLFMTRMALKWFHSFGLSNGANPLDSSFCHNLLEAARCDKPVNVQKVLISAEIS